MYDIDTSSILTYLDTMLRLVGGALKLDPAAFQAVYNYSGQPTLLLLWIVFIAGLSLMLGQSVVLFANQVKPARFVLSLVLGAAGFILNVIIFVLVVWAMANLLGERSWALPQVARAIALVSAPYWLSFLVLIPYLGLILGRLLKIYVFLTLLVALQAIFGLTFWGALLGGLTALLIAYGLNVLIGRLFTPFVTWLINTVIGPEEISDTREIYEMFARRNQVG
jgi:hypothetical protein